MRQRVLDDARAVLDRARARPRHRGGGAARWGRRLQMRSGVTRALATSARRRASDLKPSCGAGAAGSQSSSRSRHRWYSSVSPIASCGLRQCGYAAQEPAVGFVTVGHGTEALPTVAAQLVESPVVARPGVRVRRDGLVVRQRLLRRAPPTRSTPTDVRRPRSAGFRRRRVRPPRRGHREAVPGPAQEDHPSASWPHCAVRLPRRGSAPGRVDKLCGRSVVTGGLQQGCRTHQGLTSRTRSPMRCPKPQTATRPTSPSLTEQVELEAGETRHGQIQNPPPR